MLKMDIGGRTFRLEDAAIAAVRYRRTYGHSICTDWERTVRWEQAAGPAGGAQEEAVALRLVHQMIPPEERPPLEELACLCRRDGDFLSKGRLALGALLAEDPSMPRLPDGSERAFDEYDILASMAAVGVDPLLLYELPIFHIASILARYAVQMDPDRVEYRPMTGREMGLLYPRRSSRPPEGR